MHDRLLHIAEAHSGQREKRRWEKGAQSPARKGGLSFSRSTDPVTMHADRSALWAGSTGTLGHGELED